MAKIDKLIKMMSKKSQMLDIDGSPMTDESYEALRRISQDVNVKTEAPIDYENRMRDFVTGKYMDNDGKYTLKGWGK
tara:strand:+ start:501 stop:731 length:231 start_codon:yes stop_codon:yes gene_type:complete